MITTIQFILLILTTIISFILGYYLTETKYDISKYKLFNMKPFNCRKCLTFHITWVLNTILALLFNSLYMGVFGVICAIGNFVAIELDDKDKFDKGKKYYI